jgi:hypothetical protein
LRELGVFEIADGVGYHVYPDSLHPRVKRGVRSTVRAGRRITGVREAWLTEVTASSLFGRKVQAKRLKRYLKSARKVEAASFIVFRLVDTNTDSPYWVCSGIFTRTDRPKPAYRILRRLQSRRSH